MNQAKLISLKSDREYAGFGIRFLSYWVDFLIVSVFGLIIQLQMGGNPFAMYQTQSLEDIQKIQNSASLSIITVVNLLFVVAYQLIFLVNYDGATPGKKLLGIKIVRDNGEKMTYPSAFVRWIGSCISALTIFFFSLGYLWCAWDKKKQTLHDKIAGTVVIRTDKQPKTALAVLITLVAILAMVFYMGSAVYLGAQLGIKEAMQKQSVVPESVLNQRLEDSRKQDASKILSFAPSSCGLTIPIPKSTDTDQGKTRKWLYEEVPLSVDEFRVLDKDVFPVKKALGVFLGYKESSSRLGGENFSVGYPGLNVYCVDNTKSFTLDEYVSLALTNKNYKVETQEKIYWGNVELVPITMAGTLARGKEFVDIAYLAVTKGDSKLLYIRPWSADEEDPNLTAISEDLDVILRNLEYRQSK